MRLREHRGTLAESLVTAIDIEPTHAAVTSHVRRLLEPYGLVVNAEDISITHYGHDPRIYDGGWDTYIVTVEGYGVFGFTDGPVAP